MKRILILFILSFFVCNINAQKIIELEESRSGTYKISCKVNGAKMKMIFDTGASDVSLSLSMAKYLFENDYLTKDDIVDVGKARIADGSVVDNIIINIREIDVDGIILNDVNASIIETQDAPLLFGQSAIQKLGRIEIRRNQLVLLEYGDKRYKRTKINKPKEYDPVKGTWFFGGEFGMGLSQSTELTMPMAFYGKYNINKHFSVGLGVGAVLCGDITEDSLPFVFPIFVRAQCTTMDPKKSCRPYIAFDYGWEFGKNDGQIIEPQLGLCFRDDVLDNLKLTLAISYTYKIGRKDESVFNLFKIGLEF